MMTLDYVDDDYDDNNRGKEKRLHGQREKEKEGDRKREKEE